MIYNNNGYVLEKIDIQEIIPIRNNDTHKYDYGKVVIIAGSYSMPGAAALCANATIKMGAGVVYLITPRIHPAIYPEIIAIDFMPKIKIFNQSNYTLLNAKIKKADAIVIGPGVGKHLHTKILVRNLVLSNLDKKWIIDGDGICAFYSTDTLNHNVTFTPHLGEFENMLINTTKNNVFDADVFRIAKQMNCNILLKGTTTIITNGEITYYNKFGNPGMSTAGSGDVLSGIIAANIAKQNKNVFNTDMLKTIALSSTIHSLAGDYYATSNDMETLTATDIINNIKNIIKECKNN